MAWLDAAKSIWQRMNEPAQSALGYDVIADVTKRKQASSNLRSEDLELFQAQRQELTAQSRDAMRNFAIARWAVGKHLDFVSRHSFSCQTKTRFDTDVQDLMEEYSNDPNQCDITGRHTLDRIVRMTEARAVLEGDHLINKVSDGRLQQIEGDRLRGVLGVGISPTSVHGIELDKFGKAKSYKVWERMLFGGYVNPVDLPAEHVLFHAYYPNERSDQVRGIGLITAGLADFIDAYEWQDLTKATAKLRTAFGMIVTSEAMDGLGDNYELPTIPQYAPDGTLLAPTTPAKYEVELGKGPFKLEMDPGEDVKFLTDNSPSIETFEFFKSTIGFALKSLDLPLCFYDEGLANFFGNRAQLIMYIESCKYKRKNLRQNILNPLTQWLIVRWVAEGRLRLPANGRLDKIPYHWHPAGIPYWNPVQEVTADLQQIAGGLATFEDVYLERTGRDWFADMLRLKEQQKFLIDNDIKLDPKVMNFIQINSDPNQVGSSPLSQLPAGVAL
jgi:hypothetical protein